MRGKCEENARKMRGKCEENERKMRERRREIWKLTSEGRERRDFVRGISFGVVIEAARKEAMIENRDGISLKFIFVDLDNTDLPNNLWRVLSPGAMPPFLLYDENKTKIKRFEGEKLTPNSVLRFAGEDGRLEKDNDPEGLGPLHEFSPYHVLNSTQRRLRRRIVEYFFRDEWGVIFSKPIIEEMRQLLRSPKAHKAVLVATGKVDVDRSGNIEHEELGCCIFLMLSPVGMWAARRTYENSRTWKDYDAELGNRKEFKMSQIIAQERGERERERGERDWEREERQMMERGLRFETEKEYWNNFSHVRRNKDRGCHWRKRMKGMEIKKERERERKEEERERERERGKRERERETERELTDACEIRTTEKERDG
ncbi:hypothetical protein AAMO2058_000164700 [Amorphochlora amoebiformis]